MAASVGVLRDTRTACPIVVMSVTPPLLKTVLAAAAQLELVEDVQHFAVEEQSGCAPPREAGSA